MARVGELPLRVTQAFLRTASAFWRARLGAALVLADFSGYVSAFHCCLVVAARQNVSLAILNPRVLQTVSVHLGHLAFPRIFRQAFTRAFVEV